jgi:hypothetical protein
MPNRAISHYDTTQLHAKSGVSTGRGLLLRMEWEPNVFGFSDIMPFSHFGDSNVENIVEYVQNIPRAYLEGCWGEADTISFTEWREFEALQQHVLETVSHLPQFLCVSLFQNLIDARARYRNIYLYDQSNVPLSHCLLDASGLQSVKDLESELHRVAGEGFTTVKLKRAGTSTQQLQLLDWIADLKDSPVSIRCDFNASGAFHEILTKTKQLKGKPGWQTLDFVEDPCLFDPKHWAILRASGLRIAADFVGNFDSADVLIFKPAREPMNKISKFNLPVVVTHCMDSPLGRCVATFWAGFFKQIFPELSAVCGLSDAGPFFEHPDPTGYGFGCAKFLLERQWQTLLK